MTLTVTTNWPVDPDVRLRLGDQSPSEFVADLTHDPAVVDAVIDAVGRAKAALPAGGEAGVAELLREAGIDALDGAYADGLATLAETPVQQRDRVPQYPVNLTAAFGGGVGPAGVNQPLNEWADGPTALFEAADIDLQVVVELHESFRDQRREHREQILRHIVAPLAQVVDVRVVATLRQQSWLHSRHREDLPRVREECSRGEDLPDPDAAAREAAEELSTGDRTVRALEVVGSQPSETVDYDTLHGELTVSRSTVRNIVSELVDLGLLRRFGSRRQPRFELTAGGRQFYDDEIAVQRRLSECVRERRNSSDDSRVNTREDGRGGSGGESGHAAGTRWLSRGETAATFGVGEIGAVTLVDHPVNGWDRGGRGWPEPHLSVHPDRGEAVVAAEAVSPLQWLTSVALASVGPRSRSRIWTDDRRDRLDDVVDKEQWISQQVRTMGWLSDDIGSGDEYIEELADAADDLRDLTTRLGTGEYDDRNELRGEIMRFAHGLVGCVAQAADVADINLTWQVRLPEFRRNWDADRRRELARTIVQTVVVQSTYDGHTAWRHLFESRRKKRQQSPTPTVNASEPHARLLTSLVVVGDNVDAFETDLHSAVENLNNNEHDDAPEFDAQVPVKTGLTEADWRETLRRACRPKRLEPSVEAVRTARAFVESPYDLSDAITRSLSREPAERRLRADELRRALATLPSDRILPDQVPTIRQTVAALLDVDGWVSPETLADAADVSRRSVRTHRETLEQLGVIDSEGDRLRLRLAGAPDDETRWPRPVAEEWTAQDASFAAAQACYDVETLRDRTHPIMSRLYDGDRIETPTKIAPDWPFVDRWLHALRGLIGRDPHTIQRRLRAGQVDQTALTGRTEVACSDT